MAVYVAAHKAYAVREMPGYIPLQVGAALHEALPYTGDNTGDHISEKNPNYCELTGLYWVWKNSSDDYKGLVHYRRYFMRGHRLLTEEDICRILETADIILPPAEYLREPAEEEFCLYSGYKHDLVLLRQAVEAVDPTVLPAFDKVMGGNRLHLYNMFISRRETFDRYCQWLFAVLSHLEPRVDMTGYTPYQQRLYGFLGERLLNVWLTHTGAHIHTVRVVNTERRLRDTLRLWLRRQKNRLLFALRAKKGDAL